MRVGCTVTCAGLWLAERERTSTGGGTPPSLQSSDYKTPGVARPLFWLCSRELSFHFIFALKQNCIRLGTKWWQPRSLRLSKLSRDSSCPPSLHITPGDPCPRHALLYALVRWRLALPGRSFLFWLGATL